MTSFIGPNVTVDELIPVFRYAVISATDHAPSPFGREVRFGADHWRTAPPGTLSLYTPPVKASSVRSAPNELRGVWHAEQWPSASTRYAPRFHAADCFGSTLYGPASKYILFHSDISQRWL